VAAFPIRFLVCGRKLSRRAWLLWFQTIRILSVILPQPPNAIGAVTQRIRKVNSYGGEGGILTPAFCPWYCIF
jgi:hypothetical protein